MREYGQRSSGSVVAAAVAVLEKQASGRQRTTPSVKTQSPQDNHKDCQDEPKDSTEEKHFKTYPHPTREEGNEDEDLKEYAECEGTNLKRDSPEGSIRHPSKNIEGQYENDGVNNGLPRGSGEERFQKSGSPLIRSESFGKRVNSSRSVSKLVEDSIKRLNERDTSPSRDFKEDSPQRFIDSYEENSPPFKKSDSLPKKVDSPRSSSKVTVIAAKLKQNATNIKGLLHDTQEVDALCFDLMSNLQEAINNSEVREEERTVNTKDITKSSRSGFSYVDISQYQNGAGVVYRTKTGEVNGDYRNSSSTNESVYTSEDLDSNNSSDDTESDTESESSSSSEERVHIVNEGLETITEEDRPITASSTRSKEGNNN